MKVVILHAGNYAVNGLINVKRFNVGDTVDLGNDDYANGIVTAGLAEWYIEPVLVNEPVIEPATEQPEIELLPEKPVAKKTNRKK